MASVGLICIVCCPSKVQCMTQPTMSHSYVLFMAMAYVVKFVKTKDSVLLEFSLVLGVLIVKPQ